MAWIALRPITEQDHARLDSAAERFIVKHRLRTPAPEQVHTPWWSLARRITALDVESGLRPWERLEESLQLVASEERTRRHLGQREARMLAQQWRRTMRRALRVPTADGVVQGVVSRWRE